MEGEQEEAEEGRRKGRQERRQKGRLFLLECCCWGREDRRSRPRGGRRSLLHKTMTSPLLCSLLLLTMTAAGVGGSCAPVSPGRLYDPVNDTYIPVCELPLGIVLKEGDSWTDEERCIRCYCPGDCCTFGFGGASVMGTLMDGERCEPVRTGDCLHFKFVKPSDPSVVCVEFPV